MNDSATGFELPYTEAAQAARERYDPVTDDTALKCLQQGMPGIMDNPYPIEFVADGDDIELRVEEWSVVRTIHMAGYDDPESQVFTRQGYSVGRWEGDTLVVQTAKIDWPFFDDVGTPQSMDVDIVERFALSPDASRLDYEITVTDPATFTETISLDGLLELGSGRGSQDLPVHALVLSGPRTSGELRVLQRKGGEAAGARQLRFSLPCQCVRLPAEACEASRARMP